MLMMKIRESGSGGAMSASPLPADVRHGGAPLPSLSLAFSRRAALFGAVASTGFLAVAAAPVVAGKSGNEPGYVDARLVALADEVVALYWHREDHLQSDDAGYEAAVSRECEVEEEAAALAAETFVGVVAKARILLVPSIGDEDDRAIGVSLARDLVRLHAGALA